MTLTAVETELARRHLAEFARQAWHVVEPGTEYRHNWHIDAICEHLEAVSRGEIRDLIINIPPRHMKSLLVSVFWPAWEWIHRPHLRWLCASYGADLARYHSQQCREVVRSDWYQQRWGKDVALSMEQNAKWLFRTTAKGQRVATSVGGMGTGMGGERIVVDDPHNVKEGESQAEREDVIQWWSQSMSTRLNDRERGGRVIIMQRVHERDLSGYLLGHGGWEHLCLPAEYEPSRHCATSIGFEDPRGEDGEYLWPGFRGEEWCSEMKLELGPYGAAGQLQQRPAPRSGGMFERAWFLEDGAPLHRRRVPLGCDWVRYWDKAGTAGGGAYTVGLLMGRLPETGMCYIADVVRGQWSAADREARIRETAEYDADMLGGPLVCKTVVEQEPGSGGLESAQNTARNLAGYRVELDKPSGDKFTRADPLAGGAQAGFVKVVDGDWNRAFLRELEMAGPGAEYLDQMDAAAGAYNHLTLHARQVAEVWSDPDTEGMFAL